MPKNLVIVESPAKAKTIGKFLGDDYKVTSSYGHIRDLKKHGFGIDLKNHYTPIYEIPEEKMELVNNLKKDAEKADMVWLASDEDREGEAISWHLSEVLALKPESTRRIVFHEITKPAILHAIESPRTIDINLVDAQQARRVLDRIVGFELSPILWKKIKPSLSAGRVQSVAVKMIVEREREISKFQSESSFRIVATFLTLDENQKEILINTALNKRFNTKEEAIAFLEKCKDAQFNVTEINKRPGTRFPAPPFTTSTLQQEASRKLGYSVSQTMRIAQGLYEEGLITYMRTDSVNLSTLALSAAETEITNSMGKEYVHIRNYHTHSKGAQEAHEAIRPTYLDRKSIEGSATDRRLYELIWKRTIASQMSEAQIEKTNVNISISGMKENFVASGEIIKFDGFLKVYIESKDDADEDEDKDLLLPNLQIGQSLQLKKSDAQQRYTLQPPRYTEASLVKKMEELGIGRPSTYAPTISTIQAREYVEKYDRPVNKRDIINIHLENGKISEKITSENYGNDKGKLVPTDIGTIVNDYLEEHFPEIMNYNFTANVEGEFDKIAEGDENWTECIDTFYKLFQPMVQSSLDERSEHKVGERILGNDPKTGRRVSVKISRFGAVAQIGTQEDTEKPIFASLLKGQSISTITLEEALDLFKLPRTLGSFEDEDVSVNIGKYGPYVRHNNKYFSLPKEANLETISLDEAIELINTKREEEKNKIKRTFDEDPEMQVVNGRFGVYLTRAGKNYKLPKDKDPMEMSYEEFVALMKEADENPTTSRRGKVTKSKVEKTETEAKASKAKAKASTTSKTKTETKVASKAKSATASKTAAKGTAKKATKKTSSTEE